MIDTKHKFIFVHVIKTAGTSISRALGQTGVNHDTAQALRDRVGSKVWDEYFTFAFARNPWDKIYSQFKFNRQQYTPSIHSFEEYVRYFANGGQISGDGNNPRILPWITDKSGKVIVDFVGRFESLQDDFNIICNKIGIPRKKLPHLNIGERGRMRDPKSYRGAYNEETRKIIEKEFKKDIEYFRYEF